MAPYETSASSLLRVGIRSGAIVCLCPDRDDCHRHTEPRCPWGDAIEIIYCEENALDRLTATQNAATL